MGTADGFEEFVAIVDGGSVSAAAEALGLPRATLSRRLARLEERLGVRLLHRTTRRMTLTPGGEILHRKASRLVEAAREVEAEVRRLDGIPRGLLRVSTPTGTNTRFAGWIVEFLQHYPEVSVELIPSNVHVDLVADGFDLALRRGTIDDGSLIARTINIDATVAVASPAYLAVAGTPASPEALAEHSCIVGYRAGKLRELRWPLLDGGSVPVTGRLMTSDMQLRLEAVKRDLGIAMISEYLANAEIQQGTLIHVLPDLVGRRDRVSLVYADREFLDPKIRAFVDFLVDRIAAARS